MMFFSLPHLDGRAANYSLLYKCLGLEVQISSAGSYISHNYPDTGENQELKKVSLRSHTSQVFPGANITEVHLVRSFRSMFSINVAVNSENNSKINPTYGNMSCNRTG